MARRERQGHDANVAVLKQFTSEEIGAIEVDEMPRGLLSGLSDRGRAVLRGPKWIGFTAYGHSPALDDSGWLQSESREER